MTNYKKTTSSGTLSISLKNITSHFNNRCKQRLGFVMSDDEREKIKDLITENKAFPSRARVQGENRSKWYVVINFNWWEVVYDANYGELVTIYKA